MLQRVGNSRCIRCSFETDPAMSFAEQDAAMREHLEKEHPKWMEEPPNLRLCQNTLYTFATTCNDPEINMQVNIAGLEAENATLRAQLAEMTEDRNLWKSKAGGFDGPDEPESVSEDEMNVFRRLA